MPNKLLDMMYAPRFQDGGALTPQEIERLNKLKRASQLTGYGEGPGMRAFQEMGDVGRGLLGAEAIIPGGEGYRTGQALANMPAVGLAAVPGKVASALPEVVTGLGALGAGVIKPKGGNWLAGSVERAIEPLKRPLYPGRLPFGNDAQAIAAALGETPEYVMRNADPSSVALNKWIDTKLTKYVKNEMATPEDPVRALAERGVLHIQPYDFATVGLGEKRQKAGMPMQLQSQSAPAQFWEQMADRGIDFTTPERIKRQAEKGAWEHQRNVNATTLKENPWMENIPADTKIYSPSIADDIVKDAGFSHIIDELTNAMNPNSGLPASLRLTPQQLEKVTVPQAVERVAKINEWRAAQKAEADALRARNPGTFEHKTYETVPGTAKPNEKGMRWVELKLPEVTSPDQLTNPEAISKYNQYLSVAPDNLEIQKSALSRAAKIQNETVLQDALKYEGDVMGHCVGGYCPDVIEGRSRIYSLRDKKGEPHVTIEVEPDMQAGFREGEGPRTPEEDVDLRNLYINQVRTNRVPQDVTFSQWWRARNNIPEPEQKMQITQIKGKANKAPKDEYLPFVQDFVRSGNWSRVDDLQNTGLIAIDRGSDLAAAMKAENATIPKYVTQDELNDLLKKYNAYGYKRGGKVRISNNPDTMRLELLRKKHA